MKIRFALYALLPCCLLMTSCKTDDTTTVTRPTQPTELEPLYRDCSYTPLEPLKDMTKRLMISNYDRYENPTGIYFSEGDKATVTVTGNTLGDVKLIVADFSHRERPGEYELKEGINELTINTKGLAYLEYDSEEYQKNESLKISIEGGEFNGVFTDKDSNETWQLLLAGAKSPYLDMYGKYVHLVLPVDGLKEFCPDEGKELLAFYDQLIDVEQRLIGFGYKSERPKRHIFGRSVPKGYMFADGIGAGFNENTMKMVANLQALKDPRNITHGFWGLAHEFGHVNQTRPGFKWIGLTEVTNNLMAMACCYEMNKDILRLEREPHNDGIQRMPGGYYNSFTKSALIDGEKWQMQAAEGDTGHSSVGGGNVFVKLIPFWQIYLYCHVAELGNKDFYPAFHYWLRQQNPEGVSHGQHQLNFIKMACELNQQDLTEYFESIGMLKPINVEMRDYSTANLTITEEQCAEVKEFASQFKKPKTPLIAYLNANNVETFKKQAALTGPDSPGEGVEEKDATTMIISSEVWKNAVAYETYAGEKLLHIALLGIGSPLNEPVTTVYFPEGATEIKAVGWDGAKKMVLKRN